MFLEHKRRSTVARILNERGYTTRKGKKFSDTTVTRLLKNSDAKGIRKSNYSKLSTKGNKKILKSKDEWIFTPCPRIVSDELWGAVNAIIDEQEEKNNQAKPLNQKVHLFTSYLYCNNGHKMGISTKINKYTCPQCKVRIDKDDLEDVFRSRLTQFTMSDDEIEKYTKSSDIITSTKKEEIGSTKKQIDDVEQKMNRLIELNLAGQIPTKGFNQHYNPLFEQSEKLQITLEKLEKEYGEMMTIKNSLGSVIQQSKSLYENWNTFNRPEKRSIIESITNTIIFDGKTIKFKLKQIAPLSSLELGQSAQPNGIMLLHGTKPLKL